MTAQNKQIISLILILLLIGCADTRNINELDPSSEAGNTRNMRTKSNSMQTADVSTGGLTRGERLWRQSLIRQFQYYTPKAWGENIPGVMTRMKTGQKAIALTFDACGGPHGSGYDQKLIDYLVRERIPATLFINARWIDANPDLFRTLAKNRLFELENHGYQHRPLSMNGKSAWGIRGTENAAQVVDEILLNERKIQDITGRRPIYFRSGTAYYDDVSVRIVKEIGLLPVNYEILGDAGGYFNASQVRDALLSAKPGSVVLLHMNIPGKDTAEGLMAAVPILRERGFRFVKLATYPLR